MASISLGGGPTIQERRNFAGLRDGTHVPGYRGYCPQIKYRIGKTYGGDTHELKQLYGNKSTIPSAIPPDQPKPVLANRLPEPTGDNKYTCDMMPGYTGYIPRRPYRFGGTYKEDCDVCIDEHITNLITHQGKMGALRSSVKSYRKLAPIRDQRDTKSQLNLYQNTHPTQPMLKEDRRSLTEPPMPGYQGYIPRIGTTELGLGCRYAENARLGFEALKSESEQSLALQNTPVRVNRTPEDTGAKNRRLYPNKGMVPKYTGYIPQRRFNFGATYGNTTRSLDVCAHQQRNFGEFNKVAQSTA